MVGVGFDSLITIVADSARIDSRASKLRASVREEAEAFSDASCLKFNH